MPEDMKENDKFPEPIITPTLKADKGHDQDLSREEIIEQNCSVGGRRRGRVRGVGQSQWEVILH